MLVNKTELSWIHTLLSPLPNYILILQYTHPIELNVVPKHVNPFPNKPWFLSVCSMGLLKTLREKGEIARDEQFLIFPQCFLPIWITFCHFHQVQNCRLSVWKSLKFVVWEMVK